MRISAVRLVERIGLKTMIATVVTAVFVGWFTWLILPPLPRVSIAHRGQLVRTAVSRDARLLAFVESEQVLKRSIEGQLTVWDTHERRLLFSEPYKESHPPTLDGGYSLEFTRDADKLVTFGWGEAKFYEIPSGKIWAPVDQEKLPPTNWNRSSRLVTDSDGNFFVIIHDADKKTISLHDFETGHAVSSWDQALYVPQVEPGGLIEYAKFGRHLREVPTGKIRQFLPEKQDPMTGSIVFEHFTATPDCRTLLLVDGYVHRCTEGEIQKYELPAHLAPAVSPDGRLLAALVINAHNYDWHTRLLAKIGLRPHESYFAIYDLDNASEVARLPQGGLAQFSLDGKTLALFTENAVELYDVPLRSPWRWIIGLGLGAAAFVFAVCQWIRRRRERKAITKGSEKT